MLNKLSELEIGKAAEHLVCADLILKGYRSFLADQGSPYDVIVDMPSGLKRIQVKSSCKMCRIPRKGKLASSPVYRYSLRWGKGSKRKAIEECDYFAFVAMDTKNIAYAHIDDIRNKNGKVIQCLELRSKSIDCELDDKNHKPFGRYIEDHNCFPETTLFIKNSRREIPNIYPTKSGTWRVRKIVDGKRVNAGSFPTIDKAIMACNNAFGTTGVKFDEVSHQKL